MAKKAFVIPGREMVVSEYPATCSRLTAAGFDVRPINPDWESKDFTKILTAVDEALQEDAPPGSIAFGHSIGADLCLRAMVLRPELGFALASTSVACAEAYDNEETAALIEEVLPGQKHVISRLSIVAVAESAQIDPTQIAVLHGETEGSCIQYMTDVVASSFGIEPIVVAEAGHAIEDIASTPPYVDARYIDAIAQAAIHVSEAALRLH